MFLSRIQKFKAELENVGLETTSISSKSAPKVFGSGGGEEVREDVAIFSKLVVENEIVSVARDLYFSGLYNIAVAESFKALDLFIAQKSGLQKQSGTSMMESVFSPTKPKLIWTNRETTSEEDEQKGYQRLFAGSMLGIRNPTTHTFNWIDDPDTALELIVFAQHLLRKAKSSQTNITQ